MMRFNFLRDPRNPIDRLRRIEVTPRVRTAFAGLACAVGVVVVGSGASYVHLHRASEAAVAATALEAREASAARDLRSSMRTVADLDALASEIRTARGSGTEHARRVVEIADLLPAHVWLTALDDGSTPSVGGETHDYALLAETLRRFGRARYVETPLLRTSRRKDDASDTLEFTIALTQKTK